MGFRLFRFMAALAMVCLLAVGCPQRVKVERVEVSEADLRLAAEKQREGDILFARREYYPALMRYLEAGRLNPNSEIIFNKLGIVYSQLSLYKEAALALERSIALNPRYPYSYNNLGSVYFARKELGRAERMFKKAIKLNSQVAAFYVNLGHLYFERGDNGKGLDAFRRALQLDPEALTRAETVSLKAPSEDEAAGRRNFNLARLFASMGNVENCLKFLEAAAERGFPVIEEVEKAGEFDSVRQDPRFVAFIDELRLKELLKPRQSKS